MIKMNKTIVYNHRKDFLMKYLKEGKILDIGNIGGIYGKGNSNSFHLELLNKYKNSIFYGIDLYDPPEDKKHLHKNQKKYDLNDGLPYEDSFFDTIYMGQILEHLGNPSHILQEIKRCLKKDGIFVFDVPNPYSINRILKYIIKREECLADPTHLIFYTPDSLKCLIEYNNFKLLELASNWKMGKKYMWIPKQFRSGLGHNLLVACEKMK